MRKWLSLICITLFYTNGSGIELKVPLKDSESRFLRTSLKETFEIVEQFKSFSNKNYKIQETSSGDQWVFRVPLEVSQYISNRNQEKELLKWAFTEKLSLIEVKNFDTITGCLLTRFLEGRSCTSSDFQNPNHLKQALEILYHIHTAHNVPLTSSFDPLARFHATTKIAEKKGIYLAPEIYDMGAQLEKYADQIIPSCFHSALCHNDPSPENFFLSKETLFLHDWELAAYNDPAWDLTHFSVIAQIQPEKILSLYSSSDPLLFEKMTFFRPFVFFNTVIWAAFERQEQLSTLPLQITESLYQTFLKKITECIESNDFQNSLQQLTQSKGVLHDHKHD